MAIILFIISYNIEDKEAKIKNKVIGTELSYIGEDFQKYTEIVREEDIVSIDLVECGWIENKLVEKKCYRISIGKNKEQLNWYIFYDGDSLEQVKKEQLFVT